jgi:hypothetical protein
MQPVSAYRDQDGNYRGDQQIIAHAAQNLVLGRDTPKRKTNGSEGEIQETEDQERRVTKPLVRRHRHK